MATPTLTVRPLIPPSDALTFALNVSNALAAVFSLPPSPGTHPNAAAAPWTISPSGPRIPLTTNTRNAAFSTLQVAFHAVLIVCSTPPMACPSWDQEPCRKFAVLDQEPDTKAVMPLKFCLNLLRYGDHEVSQLFALALSLGP